MSITAQDFLLEAARYLEVPFFDLVDDVFQNVNSRGLSYDDEILEKATPRFAKRLNISEDEYYKLLWCLGLTGSQYSNYASYYGMNEPVTRFDFAGVLENAKTKSLYQIKNGPVIEQVADAAREDATNPTRVLDMIGPGIARIHIKNGEKLSYVCFYEVSSVEMMMLYLYKHTGQTRFQWGEETNRLYEIEESYLTITDSERTVSTYITVANFISKTEYYRYGELNPAVLEFLNRTWDEVSR